MSTIQDVSAEQLAKFSITIGKLWLMTAVFTKVRKSLLGIALPKMSAN